LPTNRSQRTTLDVDCVDLLNLVKADAADAAILVPNCPVCHQSVALAARVLEEAGIATVIMGCAKDILEHAGVPRLLFSDFPLGNAAGKPGDAASQDMTLNLALDLLESAEAPRSTVTSPLVWSDDHAWKKDYSNIALLSPEDIARRRAEFDRGKAIGKELRDGSHTA
jgi:D-proline reductase (dithiol) PrdB